MAFHNDWLSQLAKFKQDNKINLTVGSEASEPRSSLKKKKHKFLTATPVRNSQTAIITHNTEVTDKTSASEAKQSHEARLLKPSKETKRTLLDSSHHKLDAQAIKSNFNAKNQDNHSIFNQSQASKHLHKKVKLNSLSELSELKQQLEAESTLEETQPSNYGYNSKKKKKIQSSYEIAQEDLVGKDRTNSYTFQNDINKVVDLDSTTIQQNKTPQQKCSNQTLKSKPNYTQSAKNLSSKDLTDSNFQGSLLIDPQLTSQITNPADINLKDNWSKLGLTDRSALGRSIASSLPKHLKPTSSFTTNNNQDSNLQSAETKQTVLELNSNIKKDDLTPTLSTTSDSNFASLAQALVDKFNTRAVDSAFNKEQIVSNSNLSIEEEQDQANLISAKLTSWLYGNDDSKNESNEESLDQELEDSVNRENTKTANFNFQYKQANVNTIQFTKLYSKYFLSIKKLIEELLGKQLVQQIQTTLILNAVKQFIKIQNSKQLTVTASKVEQDNHSIPESEYRLNKTKLNQHFAKNKPSQNFKLQDTKQQNKITESKETAIYRNKLTACEFKRYWKILGIGIIDDSIAINSAINKTIPLISISSSQLQNLTETAFLADKFINFNSNSNTENYIRIQLLQELTLVIIQLLQDNQARLAAIPANITYNNDLPVSQSIEQIRQLLQTNQVIIIAGDTGSGKTTQIPKLCLELGLSTTGLIGHTQPRRLAASSVAKRIAQELDVDLGNQVGYKVRFTDQVSPLTHIKLMTDGILLAEIQNDPLLYQYSCLIIDEAHERSLNNEFIIGYLKLILNQRPDLKIIITSATINLKSFSKHFNHCPIIKVEGRTYPVEVRYRPLSLSNFNSNRIPTQDWEQQIQDAQNQQVAIAVYTDDTISTQGVTLGSQFTTTNFDELKQELKLAKTKTSNVIAKNVIQDANNQKLESATKHSITSTALIKKTQSISKVTKDVDPIFGLSTVNPYASEQDIESDSTSQAQHLTVYTKLHSQSQSQSANISKQEINDATLSLDANTTISTTTTATQNTQDWLQETQVNTDVDFTVEENHGFGSSITDQQAFKNYSKYAEDDNGLDLSQGVIAATEELFAEEPGDILVFLSGEREIHDIASELSHHFTQVNRRFANLRILPLYSRLPSSEQELIFKPNGALRIILATNIAETSLTVPGIKYVIDAGTARISRYSYKTHVQGLPIEPISQASADQRKGRCGRTSPGICIRLYSELDYNNRPQFTEPEIKRTNLSSIILQMLNLGLPDIANFPFLDTPNTNYIRNGLKLLHQLQAIKIDANAGYKITELGKKLSSLPVDPRLARMIIAAQEHGCVNELLIIAAGMTVVDVRERPTGKQQQAQQAHAEYKDDRSDYSSLLNLWNFLNKDKLSNNQFRKLCKSRYLNYLRIREWQDLYQQLKRAALGLKLSINQVTAEYSNIHRAMISGLLDHLAQLNLTNSKASQIQYKGANNKHFKFFPTSSLYKKRYSWVLSSEIIHLTNTYALRGASIEAKWVEQYAKHLFKYSYTSPHWSKKRGEVVAYMSASLFGLNVIENKLVSYTNIDRQVSRDLFIRQALVEQNWDCNYPFYNHNNQVIAQALALEEQQRRHGIIVHEQDLYDWYNAKIPKHVFSNITFKQWWKSKEAQDPHYLDLDYDSIIEHMEQLVEYPEFIQDNQLNLKLHYIFNPKQANDGVSVLIPIQFLANLDYKLYQWHIPQYRTELVAELIKCLPKKQRKQLIPASNYAQAFTERVKDVIYDNKGKVVSFYAVLSQFFKELTGVYIEVAEWQVAHNQLASHLRLHFQVLDLKHQVLGASDDLIELQQQLAPKAQQIINQHLDKQLAKATVYTTWEFDRFGEVETIVQDKVVLETYPALVPVLSLTATQQSKILSSDANLAINHAINSKSTSSTVNQITQVLDSDLQVLESVNKHYLGATEEAISDILKGSINRVDAKSTLSNAEYFKQIAQGVIIKNTATRAEQHRVMHAGLRDLLLLNSLNPITYLRENLPNQTKLALYFAGNVQLIIGECICCAADHIMVDYDQQAQAYSLQQGNVLAQDGSFIWDKNYYQYLLQHMHSELNSQTIKVAQTVEQILILAHKINKQLRQNKALAVILALNDLKQQLAALTRENFVATHSLEQLMLVPKYLEGMLYRMERMMQNPTLDHQRQVEVNNLEQQYQDLKVNWPAYRDIKPLVDLFFMLQELRISLFAQSLGTSIPVSAKRVQATINDIKEQIV